MKKSLSAGMIALGMLICFALTAGRGSQKPPLPKPPVPGSDFKGKVLVVFSKSQPPGAILEKVAVRELAQRFFLVGKAPDDKSRWAGSTIWLAMDEVSMIAVFDSLDDARKATENK